MGVGVDEAGHDHLAAGVDDASVRSCQVQHVSAGAHEDDAAVEHGQGAVGNGVEVRHGLAASRHRTGQRHKLLSVVNDQINHVPPCLSTVALVKRSSRRYNEDGIVPQT